MQIGGMKRIATHRVYDLSMDKMLSNQVVEMDDAGIVCRYFPLGTEIQGTEWLPGAVIVSRFPLLRKDEESFEVFLDRIRYQEKKKEEGTSCNMLRAYWVHPFNVLQMEFFPHSRIFSL